MNSIKRFSLISLIGMFLLVEGLQGQASIQIHASVEMPMGQIVDRTQKSLGVEYQHPLGDNFVLGAGLHAKTWFVNLPFLESSNTVNTEVLIFGSQMNGVIDPFFGLPGLLLLGADKRNSSIRFDIPVYVGIRLSKHKYLPLLLNLGIGNKFARKLILDNGTFVPDGLRYAIDSELGLQIPLFRSLDWGLSMEPYYQYGRALDFPIELLPLNIFRPSVHSFGIRMQGNIFR